MTERTLILIKPDGVQNGHVGEIISRIERKGLRLAELDLRVADRETAEKHYAEHADKPFFGELVDFITSAPLIAPLTHGASWLAAPIPSARPPRAPSVVILRCPWRKTSSTVLIPQNPQSARSGFGSRTCKQRDLVPRICLHSVRSFRALI